MADQPVSTSYVLWHRSDDSRPWLPVRRTRTHADAVLWIGVDVPDGQWLVLRGGKRPDVTGDAPRRHPSALPRDLTPLRTDSPPPTPEQCRDGLTKRRAIKAAERKATPMKTVSKPPTSGDGYVLPPGAF